MGCQLEVISQPYSSDGAQTGIIYPSECPPDCTGPEVWVEKRAVLFGKWVHIDRTVSVCPVSGQEHVAPLLADILGATGQPS